jgi:hypothetical protein
VWNTIKDLHLELILMYHRVCLKLAGMGPDPAENIPKPFKRKDAVKQVSTKGSVGSYLEWVLTLPKTSPNRSNGKTL